MRANLPALVEFQLEEDGALHVPGAFAFRHRFAERFQRSGGKCEVDDLTPVSTTNPRPTGTAASSSVGAHELGRVGRVNFSNFIVLILAAKSSTAFCDCSSALITGAGAGVGATTRTGASWILE